MQCIEAVPILECSEGTPIGLVFYRGSWYKYSNHLNAWCRCNDDAALSCAVVIAAAIAKLPFAVEFPDSSSHGGGHAIH